MSEKIHKIRDKVFTGGEQLLRLHIATGDDDRVPGWSNRGSVLDLTERRALGGGDRPGSPENPGNLRCPGEGKAVGRDDQVLPRPGGQGQQGLPRAHLRLLTRRRPPGAQPRREDRKAGLESELLAAWLNRAHGGVNLTAGVGGTTTVKDALTSAENRRLRNAFPPASISLLRKQVNARRTA